jgi:glycosyltransferase involved in cell wall biosynthesis
MDWGVRAFAAFCKANPTKSCWLVLGGEGQSRHSLERLARELNIADRVKFLGWVSSSHAFNTALDIYVLPSRAEGFGIALIESMATECACVATDSGGPREIITEPKIGWLVPREDELAFASALSEAMSMSLEQLRTIGRAARCSVQQRFDEATLSEALLLEILGTPSSP